MQIRFIIPRLCVDVSVEVTTATTVTQFGLDVLIKVRTMTNERLQETVF